jgi:hypothetical protein
MNIFVLLKFFLILLFVNTFSFLNAQQAEICGPTNINTGPLPKGSLENEIASFQQMQMHSGGTTPTHIVRLFVRIAANNDGSDPVSTEDDVIRTIQFTKSFFEPHGICLQLVGIDFINNANLRNLHSSSAPLKPYLKNDCLTMFVVESIYYDGDSISGIAYDIPNTFFSVKALSKGRPGFTTAHEIGHCLGLLHTFETAKGAENVTRNKNNSCFDCEDDGDYLCDTPADPHQRTANGKEININEHIDDNCNYLGVFYDNCNEGFRVDVTNIMSYALASCKNKFTIGQGARMRYHLNNDSDLQDMQAKPTLLLTSFNPLISFYSARDLIIIQTSQNYTAQPIVKLDYLAPNILISSNAQFGVTNNQQDIILTTDTRCN